MSAYIYMYDEQVVDVFFWKKMNFMNPKGENFTSDQTQNWDLVSLMRADNGYSINCIYSGNRDGGFYNNCIISIVLCAHDCAIRYK